MQTFDQTYASLNDQRLLQLAAERHTLVPEAQTALDTEISKRHLSPVQYKTFTTDVTQTLRLRRWGILLSTSETGLLSTTGRISRIQYFLRVFPAAVVLTLLTSGTPYNNIAWYLPGFVPALLVDSPSHDIAPGELVLALFISAFMILQGIKRLHDLNLSGWWGLVSGIPYLGLLWGIIIVFTRGTRGTNRYGPDPLPAPLMLQLIQCWQCKNPIEVTPDIRGRKKKCPSCGTRQYMPM